MKITLLKKKGGKKILYSRLISSLYNSLRKQYFKGK